MEALPWFFGATFVAAISMWFVLSRSKSDEPPRQTPPVTPTPAVSQHLLETPAPVPPRAGGFAEPEQDDFDLPTEVMTPEKVKQLLHGGKKGP